MFSTALYEKCKWLPVLWSWNVVCFKLKPVLNRNRIVACLDSEDEMLPVFDRKVDLLTALKEMVNDR